jgi:hypothetical protein
MKIDEINYSQEYIGSHYMEFSIPSKDNEVKKIFLRKKN